MPISLAAHDVRHSFGAVLALDGVSVDVDAGGFVALVGESGSGKTTLLRCFNRLVTPGAGRIEVGAVDVRGTDPVELRRRLGYVPQHGGLLPHWTVEANVGFVLRASGRPERHAAAEALDLVGLAPAEFGSRFPGQLSGGQRQRVALARALAAQPGAILLDEPFGALDAITRADIQNAFDQVRRRLGITSLLVTHDLGEAARLADEIVVMRAGRVEQRGAMSALRSAPASGYVRALVGRAVASAEALTQ